MSATNGGLIQYQAPVLGYGASTYFKAPGYVDLGEVGNFGNCLGEGFSFIVDFQSDSIDSQYIFGVISPNKTSLGLHIHPKNSYNRLQFDLLDGDNRSLSGYCNLSKAASKRVFINVEPRKGKLRFYELNLFRSHAPKVTYICTDSLRSFSNLKRSLFVGGCNSDDQPFGWFHGRIANFGIINRPMLIEEKDELFKNASEELVDMVGIKNEQPLESERVDVFIADLKRLRGLSQRLIFTDQDTKDASLILVKWLFDRNPVLLDLCDELGIQITFPGHNEKEVTYMQNIIDLNPSFFQVGNTGPGGRFGFDWVSAKEFGNQITFCVENNIVKQADLIRFITDKLGGRHLDLKERNKWQRQLKLLSDNIHLMGNKAINYQVKVIVENVIRSIDSCGVERQITIQN